jgi:hypothetical protein
MNRLRTRWTAWPIALLMVLSLSGVAGASALISFKQPATHVAQTSDEDEDGDDQGENAEDQGDDEKADEDADEAPEADKDVEDQDSEDAAKLPTAEDLAKCATDTVTEADLLPRDGESHGEYVSRIAHSDATAGPNDNHGFCVSAAARGLFEAPTEETPPTTEQPTTECNGWLEQPPAEDTGHGEFVSQVAQDKEAVGGPHNNHGYCVSRAARGDFNNEDTTEESSDSAQCGTAEQPTDVEDQDVDDATASCDEKAEKAKDKAEKAKDKAEKKAEKAKKAKFEHGKRRGKGHRP